MTKSFTWLRVVTYINLVVFGMFLLILIVQLIGEFSTGFDPTTVPGVAALSFVLLHTRLTIVIQRRFYPDKLIYKSIWMWWRVAAGVSWAVAAAIGGSMIIFFFLSRNASPDTNSVETAYMVGYIIGLIISFVLFVGLLVLQLVGANHLVRTIKENHELDLENSFL